MELSCELADLEEEINIEKIDDIEYEKIAESTLIPKVGYFLGLDISETSSGVCMYENGEKFVANISLECKDKDFLEVKLRRELKGYLTEVVKDKTFDLIIIEDAFQGVNALVTRTLYALNTAIDELILDGVCKCKDFRRINNQLWKSWLFKADQDNIYKGMEDKLRIEKCLELLGVYEYHDEGYQDRLDATGLILGYMLCKDSADEYEAQRKLKRVALEDIRVAYDTEQEFCLIEAGYGYRDIHKMFINDKHISKKLITDYLTNQPDLLFITNERVSLGMFGSVFNLPVMEDGGYFAFWIDEKKVNKYMGKLEE